MLLGNDGLILTTYQDIQGARSLIATTVDGNTAPLNLLAHDRVLDLALLQTTSPLPEPEPLVWSARTGTGSPVFVLGFSFPSSRSLSGCSDSVTVAHGTIAGRPTIQEQERTQTDIGVSTAISGGLAVTNTGLVAGLSTSQINPDKPQHVLLIPARTIETQLSEWIELLALGQLAPPSTQIVFSSRRNGMDDIYRMSGDGSFARQLTDNPGGDYQPAWSPHGSEIAFASDRDGDLDIYTMDADGSNVRRLTDHPGRDSQPAWSSDGKRIAFVSDRDGTPNIYVMDVTGNNVHPLISETGWDFGPAWSPDGTRIAFASDRDGNDDIYILDTISGTILQLTHDPASDSQPSWSPDSSQIAYVSNRDGDLDIYVMAANAGDVHQLTNHPAWDWNPVWSPDGMWIAFDSNRGGDGDIYVCLLYTSPSPRD